MHSRTIAAIAACTRTLGEAREADAPLLDSGVVTVGPLRALADRAALRARCQQTAIHQQHLPQDPDAAALYESLEAARLDAIGARWLTGVAMNLLAFPGRDPDGVRWLAFERFSGLPAPRESAGAASAARAALTASLATGLDALGALLHDQARFSEAAARWSVEAGRQGATDGASASVRGFDIPDAPSGNDVRRGRYALPGRSREESATRQDAGGGAHAAAADPDSSRVAALTGYRAYTTAFDRVVNAAQLAGRDELEIGRAHV